MNMKRIRNTTLTAACLVGLALILAPTPAAADQQILDDLIVDGSACIGQDCVNGESFGFDTIRIKENNLRIKAQDTSTSASFPTQDWQLTFNDSANGGQNKFSIDAISPNSGTPFTIEASNQNHALYVDDGGRIGFGTSTPVADLHVKSGNTPTLRLEQDGSSGFAAQTWDVAGNEANFFIRDASNGSTLPLRIFPDSPSNRLNITSAGVGIGTTTPQNDFHIKDTGANAIFDVESGQRQWRFSVSNSAPGDFRIRDNTGGQDFMTFTGGSAGNVTIAGTLVTGGGGTCAPPNPACDGVFFPDYELESIDDHASYMWQNQHLPAVGPTRPGEPINITLKTTAVLNELEKAHIYIEQLHKRLEKLEQAAADDEND
jgi:hypothetical protein